MSFRLKKGCVAPLLLIVILSSVPEVVFSQKNFLPGFIIKTEQDTLFGEINYKDWEQNPDTIEYRSSSNADIQLLTPEDITTFFAGGDLYKSRQATIDETPYEILPGNQIIGVGKSSREGKIFLEVLLQSSSVNLFMYRHGRNNFYIEGQNNLIELISHEYTSTTATGNHYVVKAESKDYQKQLESFFQYCKGQSPLKTNYSEKSLMKFVQGCFDTENKTVITFTKEVESVRFKSGLYGGISLTKFEVPFNWGQPTFKSTGDITIGYSAMLVLPRDYGKRSILIDLIYQRVQAESDKEYRNSRTLGDCAPSFGDCVLKEDVTISDLELNMDYLKLNVGYKHKFLSKGITPFIIVGVGANYILNHDSRGKTERSNYYQYRTSGDRVEYNYSSIEEEILDPTKLTYGAIGGVGVQYNWVSFILKHERGFGNTNLHSFSTTFLLLTIEYPFK